MSTNNSLTHVSLAVAASLGAYVLLRGRRKRRKTFPGPPRYPIIGNLLSLPNKLNSDFFVEAGELYDSDVLHFEGLGVNVIVINSYQVAQELLEKRSGIYSGRPHSTMFHDLSGWGYQFSMWPYGDSWRAARKLFTRYFSSPETHQPYEVVHIHRLLRQLLEHPEDFFTSIKHVSACSTLAMTYGIKITSSDDPYLKMVTEGAEVASNVLGGGAHMVDLIPAMKYLPSWFPGASFQKLAAYSRAVAYEVLEKPFVATKDSMKEGNYGRSFLTSLLEDIQCSEPRSQDEDFLKDVAGQVFIAGSDTSASALGTFLLVMVTYPNIQKKAQAELDAILQGHLPEHKDLSSLPYLNAVILEVLRWKPVLPIGVPHLNIYDDIYDDYHIPIGSTIIPNHRAMLFDEEDFPDPHSFKPERFLKDGKLNPSVRSPLDIAFGFGRRICAGRHVALSMVTLTAASVLSVFDLQKCNDESGKAIEPKGDYMESILSHPCTFPCDVKPRSSHAVNLIQSLGE